MSKKVIRCLIVLSLVCCLSPSYTAKARVEEPLKISMNDEDIVIHNKTIKLFGTFTDNEQALQAIQTDFNDLLTDLMDAYSLSPLFSQNITDYSSASSNRILNDFSNKRMIQLHSYLQTYMNRYENDAIIELSELYESTKDNDLLRAIDERTPYTSEKVYQRISTRARPFYVDDAVRYAEKYATGINYAYSNYGDNDCTNFASQIVIAGGIPQYITNDKQTGWWCKPPTASMSWINANRFCNWYGISYQTKDHQWFAKTAERGNFVALDYEGDGVWDHVGFVTDKEGYMGKWTDSKGNVMWYHDYRIAQHSDGYNSWASWDSNHWEEAERGGATYGIVRTPG